MATYRRRPYPCRSLLFLTTDAERIRLALRHCVFSLRRCFCDHWAVVSDQLLSKESELLEIIADNLSKAGFSLGWVSALDSEARTIWITDAHRGDGKRFIVRADEKLTAFVELERAVCIHLLSQQCRAQSRRRKTVPCPNFQPSWQGQKSIDLVLPNGHDRFRVKSGSSGDRPPDILPAGRKLRRVHSQRTIN